MAPLLCYVSHGKLLEAISYILFQPGQPSLLLTVSGPHSLFASSSAWSKTQYADCFTCFLHVVLIVKVLLHESLTPLWLLSTIPAASKEQKTGSPVTLISSNCQRKCMNTEALFSLQRTGRRSYVNVSLFPISVFANVPTGIQNEASTVRLQTFNAHLFLKTLMKQSEPRKV